VILKPGESVLNLPAAVVGQLVIVHERQLKGKGPGKFGPVVMVKPGTTEGVIKRSTMLMRVRESDMLLMTKSERHGTLVAMPLYWCVRDDGRVGIWPAPDQAYDCEVMGRNGMPIGGQRVAPVAVVPIDSYVAAYTKAAEETARLAQSPEPERVSRFTLPGDEE
jgi:hypothetical protein